MRAHVYFWNGHLVGPMISTDNNLLEHRLRNALKGGTEPSFVSALFVAQTFAREVPVELYNAPPGRTTSQIVAAIMREDCWPGFYDEVDPQNYGNEAGVFLVNTITRACTMIGGHGFGLEEVNPREERVVHISVTPPGEPDAG